MKDKWVADISDVHFRLIQIVKSLIDVAIVK